MPQDFLAGVLPGNPLRGMGIKAPRKKRKQELDEEDQQSLISNLGHASLGGLQTIGNILDVPGGMVRNLVTGHNPLTPLLHPISGEGRVSGEDILDNLGIKHENDPTKWEAGDVAHPVGGFGVEMALDPLTYLTFGASALTKAGKAAKAAGKLTRGVKAGIQAGERGLVGVGLPFKHPSFVLGTGAKAQKIAGGIDKAYDVARYSKPGRAIAAAFDSRVKGLQSEAFQRAATTLHGLEDADIADIGQKVGRWATELHHAAGPGFDPHDVEQMRRIFEGIEHVPHPAVQKVVGEVHDELSRIIPRAAERGIPATQLKDAFAQYIPAYLSKTGGAVPGKGVPSVFSAFEPSQMARRAYLKDLPGGRATIIGLSKDPILRDLLRTGDEAQITAHIAKNPNIPATFTKTTKSGKVVQADRHKAIAKFLARQSEDTLNSGIFGNTPLLDVRQRVTRAAGRSRAADTLFDVLADHVKQNPGLRAPGSAARAPEGTVRLADVMKQLKLKAGDAAGGWQKQIADRLGIPAQHIGTKGFQKAFGKMRIGQEMADDALRLFDRFKGPTSTSMLGKAVDTATNLFKAGVTAPFPSFHTRNLASGQVQNALHGMFGAKSVRVAHEMLQGRTVKGAAAIPSVAAELAQHGLPATDEAGTDILRQMVFGHGLGGKYAGEAIHRAGTDSVTGSAFGDILDSLPGMSGPMQPGHIAKQFVGRAKGTTLNPLKATIRGAFESPETTFGPIKAGESVGAYVEHLNRVAPFLNQLKKGVDPGEAAKRVLGAQVDYSPRNYTAFERDVLKRLIPFYSFQKGITQDVAKQLLEKPGGPLAQTLRATSNASHSEGPLPEYVTQSTPIPLGHHPDGTASYITGLGLMHESPFGLVGGNPLSEIGSMLNPLVKMPIEHATGRSMFQSGRSLDELDPVLGRTLANLTGREDPIRTPRLLEELISNSPLARAGTFARTLTDSRKSLGTKALNLGTGVRVSDISPSAQDAVLRQALKDALKGSGARAFEDVYMPEEKLARMSPAEQQQVRNMQALMQVLAKRAKTRKAAKKKAG